MGLTKVEVGFREIFAKTRAINVLSAARLFLYLILDYTDGDKVALNVGFYCMANAGGRLVGCLLSGVLFEWAGLPGCLWGTFAFAAMAALMALALPAPCCIPGCSPPLE